MKQKSKVVKPARPKTMQELIAEYRASLLKNSIPAESISTEHQKNREELIKDFEASQRIMCALKPKKQCLENSFPAMQARVYSYNEISQMCYDYISVDFWRCTMIRWTLYRDFKSIATLRNGDTSKVKYWSPDLNWLHLKLITEEYPTTNAVIVKSPIVARKVVDGLKVFYSRHLN